MIKISIYWYTVANGLTCIETIEETPERARRWALEALRAYAMHRSAGTQCPVPTGWLRVGNYICCAVGDYFALCYQPEA